MTSNQPIQARQILKNHVVPCGAKFDVHVSNKSFHVSPADFNQQAVDTVLPELKEAINTACEEQGITKPEWEVSTTEGKSYDDLRTQLARHASSQFMMGIDDEGWEDIVM